MDRKPVTDNSPETPVRYRLRLSANGRVVIPFEVRDELGLADGDEIMLTRDPDGFRLTTRRDAVAHARAVFERVRRPDQPLSDEIVARRRDEAIAEDRDPDQE